MERIIYTLLMWAVTIYAFRRGGWEERLCCAAFVISSYTYVLLLGPAEGRFQQIEFLLLFIDLCVFLIVAGINLASRKFWPMWATAMVGILLLQHLLPLMPGVPPYLYGSAMIVGCYPTWLLVAFGVRQHSLAHRRGYA